MTQTFDRAREDVGNVLQMEHVNLTVPDQELAALFYVSTLGGTRDPYIDFGTFNMWVNLGEQQFHLPKSKPQRLRGHIGINVPSLDELRGRLDRFGKAFENTQFGWEVCDDHLSVRCPWGNELRCYAGDDNMGLGIRYLETLVPADSAPGIASFYFDVFGAPATVNDHVASISVGVNQELRFRETDRPLADYDGHHIAIYVANFSAGHSWLEHRGLVTEESDAHQYRFVSLTDPENDRALTQLEHEVRSMRHPMYGRHLVNRNSAIGFFNFRRGREVFVP